MSVIERLRVLSNSSNLTQDELDTVMAAIRAIESLHKEMRDQEREFQREARGIAAEAVWQERQSHDGDYGSY
jgi:hypothetical protein